MRALTTILKFSRIVLTTWRERIPIEITKTYTYIQQGFWGIGTYLRNLSHSLIFIFFMLVLYICIFRIGMTLHKIFYILGNTILNSKYTLLKSLQRPRNIFIPNSYFNNNLLTIVYYKSFWRRDSMINKQSDWKFTWPFPAEKSELKKKAKYQIVEIE